MTPARARREEGSTAAATVQLCSFRVGDEHYVLDIMRIREIVNPLPVTPVRQGGDNIEGVVDLRGEIIPVVDLRRRLGLERAAMPTAKYVIANVSGRAVGLVVDVMGRVIEVPRAQIRPSPALAAGGSGVVFPGVVNHQGVLYLLLDVKALLGATVESLSDLRRAALGSEQP